ncbi:ATP-binding cassette domain-containing protein [Micromonospora endophytica]|uniref:ABC transporter n=1 Tax=Micromonospora endophytica TaxID=515350 RepID=A0A2W2E6R6_9ACTN|nr:ATP-binding cassette domain-containing protein [Micromonospora endophytica]PZG00574.1 ABC transporter [Micromonospora endophytica]RIW45882.1 ATP-binding cassette domain-containing protein [Micromonospora endophytica]
MIEANGLTRTFRAGRQSIAAVRGVDLRVEAGEIVGFLGPNGAGKTTTLRMLTTLLRPTSGTARIAGADLATASREVRRRIGYVAQYGGTDPNALVEEELFLQARLYRIAAAPARRRVAALLEELDLGGLGARPVGSLSGGQRRRLDIALGLVHEPPVVFLDEPTAGLDPHSRNNLWEHTRRLRDDNGTTVFLTTHYLDEADALCDRILVIDHGRIVAEDTPANLKRQLAADVLTVAVVGDPDAAQRLLAGLPGVRQAAVTSTGDIQVTLADGEQGITDVITALSGAGFGVRALQLARPSLDDVFLNLTGRELRDDPRHPSAPIPTTEGTEHVPAR